MHLQRAVLLLVLGVYEKLQHETATVCGDSYDVDLCCAVIVHFQVNFTPGQVVWQERDPANCQFFIIREGTANLKDAGTGAVTSKLGPGKYFGQQSLVGSGALGVTHATDAGNTHIG